MPGYNERAWAADIISTINGLAVGHHMPIRRAGGEYSVADATRHLFPDVLLFKDPQAAVILQGWELKFPDTDIRDDELFVNATAKANALGLDSFLLWNVTFAELYVRRNGEFGRTPIKRWPELSDIRMRDEVQRNEDRWRALLARIIADLNDRFARGDLEGRPFVEAYRSGGVVELILANQPLFASSLAQRFGRNAILEAEVTHWWESIRDEHSGGFSQPAPALARFILINWVGKFLLAHYLMQQDQRVRNALQDDALVTADDAVRAFEALSQVCDFWTVFGPLLAQAYTNSASWSDLTELHRLLSDLRVGGIDHEQLLRLLEDTVDVGRRKLHGQYTTPSPLAHLLVRLALDDKSEVIGDFCCGTGTIPRAALSIKQEYRVSPGNAAQQVWASDRFMEPLQLATLAMASMAPMSSVLQVFSEDAFVLTPEYVAQLRDPHSGAEVRRALGQVDAIATNLPFVAQAGRALYVGRIAEVNQWLSATGLRKLSGQSDVAAYLPFALWRILRTSGRVAMILTASWIDTNWTDEFREALLRCYNLRAVVVSGCGRWFDNADIVTHVLLLEKRETIADPPDDEEVSFCVTERHLDDLADAESNRAAAAAILTGRALAEQVRVRKQRHDRLREITALGVGWNAQFVNCDWVTQLPLVLVSSLFNMGRGERRGWNAMFYPAPGHGIENEYLTPVLRSPTNVVGYIATPDRVGFTCGETIEELARRGHLGALAWIRRFEDQVNKVGEPLVHKLARSGLHWYEMKPNTTADIVIPINFGDRLFMPRLQERSFVDQRLSYMRAQDATDVDLAHALLNTVVAYFWIEGMGFGRGLGALDLNADKVRTRMRMMDPSRLNADARSEIVRLFEPVRNREVFDLPDELDDHDRVAFDRAVLAAYGIEDVYNRIKSALLSLFSIRKAATAE
ncbi:MAG: N-6 DNA methylase [Phycisphaerales bacterium]|nr:N-6 DNA methylase [Phycisphaerales bacterium]